MKYLLDTHVVLWWLQNSKKLSRATRKIIEREDCVVSVLSVWEMLNKHDANQLKLPDGSITEAIASEGFTLLPLSGAHIEAGFALNDMHDDPFDRMLVGTAKSEGLALLTRDAAILERAAKHLPKRLIEV